MTKESERGVVVERLVKFDVISAICDVIQTSDEDFVRYATAFSRYEQFQLTDLPNFEISHIPTRVSQLKGDSLPNFVRRVVLECFEILSAHKEFYENQAAVIAIQTMLRLSYCINKSLKDSMLFEKLIQGVSDILVRYILLIVVYYYMKMKCDLFIYLSFCYILS